MRPSEIKLPDELDERLREWARVFRDRRRLERCKSLEGRFNPFHPGSWDTGWGDPEGVPAYLPPVVMPRVLRTHACVMRLGEDETGRLYKWGITYAYCYPGLERWLVLKAIRKYTGLRLSWVKYLDAVDMARIRVWACMSN